MMEGWKEYIIGDFGDIYTGTTPSTKHPEYYNGEFKFISPADLDNGKYITTAHKMLTKEGLKVSRTLPKNAVLIGCIRNIGKIGMTNDEISAFNQQINAIACNEQFLPDFIYYLLLFSRPLLEKSAVKTTLPILNKGNFQKIKLKSPPLPEQRRIAYVLSAVQKAIEQQDKLIRATTELKKALMQKLFTEGTKGEKQKMTEIGPVPESWEVVKIGNVFKFSSGKSRPKNTVKERTVEFNIPVYGGNGILGYTNESFQSKITLILGRVGEYCGCAHLTEQQCWISDNALYAKEQFLDVDLVFIKNCFEWLNLNKYSNKMGQPLITQGIINEVRFGMPSIQEQKKIANTLNLIDSKIQFHQKKKQTLIDLFRTLLHELMTGARRVNEIEFEKVLNHDYEGLKDAHDFQKSSNQVNQKNQGSDK